MVGIICAAVKYYFGLYAGYAAVFLAAVGLTALALNMFVGQSVEFYPKEKPKQP